ncbi:MAG: LysM peptidoglycan-binding domain-containing protein [Planctomycetota bacterium]|nr:LysM peptidoglycan-binding domain-containing protein [Planctomycetota bacterium]
MNDSQTELLYIPLEAEQVEDEAGTENLFPGQGMAFTNDEVAPSTQANPDASQEVKPQNEPKYIALEEPKPEVVVDKEPTKVLYTIKASDTLSEIAFYELGSVRYVKNIVELNPGVNASNLSIGDTLVLPARADLEVQASAVEASASTNAKVHEVVSGDSLYLIANKYYPGKHEYIAKIVAANKSLLKSGENTVLRIGWKLNLPE